MTIGELRHLAHLVDMVDMVDGERRRTFSPIDLGAPASRCADW
jgi:hypothetical protein